MPSIAPLRTLSGSLSAVALIVGLLALANPAQAAFPGANGKIGFDSNRLAPPNNFDIFHMNWDGGTEMTVLFNSVNVDAEPSWSPDGSKIAFRTGTAIWTMNANGSSPTALGTDGANPTWSPDGTKIAFNTNADGDDDLFVKNSDGSGSVTPIGTNNTASDRNPSWSPDGTKIAFESNSDGSYEIYTRPADGSGTPTAVTNTTGVNNTRPDWSPDGLKIAFTRDISGDEGIHTINENGTGEVPVQSTAGPDETDPAWSPDGTKIAYTSNVFTDQEIFWKVVGATTSSRITVHPEADVQPTWQPLYQIPRTATQVSAALVPAFRQTISTTQCAARGGTATTHGAPDIPGGTNPDTSCTPPGFLPGTNAAFGIQSQGSVTLSVVPGNPNLAGDQADTNIFANLSDVRTGSALGADYTPGVTMAVKLRITDTLNGASQNLPATVQDLDLTVPINCLTSADTRVGSICSTSTSVDGQVAGLVKEGRNAVVNTFRIRLRDAGNREFATQGYYNP